MVAYDAVSGLYEGDAGNIALEGEHVVTAAEVGWRAGRCSISTPRFVEAIRRQ